MSAADTAKDIIRIASTAHLSKDIIDLLEKKLALLTDENAMLATKVSQLEVENRQLKTQVQNSQTVTGAFQEHFGVLWKRMGKGFEPFPYCKQCANHPVMYGQPPFGDEPELWQCSKCGFIAPFAGRPKV